MDTQHNPYPQRVLPGWLLLTMLLVIALGVAVRLAPPENPNFKGATYAMPLQLLVTLRRSLGILPVWVVVAGTVAGVVFLVKGLSSQHNTIARLASLALFTISWAPLYALIFLAGIAARALRNTEERTALETPSLLSGTPRLFRSKPESFWSTFFVFLICWGFVIVGTGALIESGGYAQWTYRGSHQPLIHVLVIAFFIPLYFSAIRTEWRVIKEA